MDDKQIINEIEDDVDGIVYIVTIFSDGQIKKRRKEGYENAITNTEERELEMAMNMQYLVDIAEINMEE